MKTTLLILIAVLAAGLWLQFDELQAMRTELAEHRGRLQRMEDELRSRGDVSDLLTRFVARNSKRILNLQRTRSLTVTAYSPRIRETDSTPYTTASNKRVRQGIVAVSRDLFNSGWVFGKKVYIKEHGLFTIDDLMAADKRNQIDIFMDDTQAALAFGKKTLSVSLVDL